MDSPPASYTGPEHLQDGDVDAEASRPILASNDDSSDTDRETEPMFNFRSLAEVVGVSLEGENAGCVLARPATNLDAIESSPDVHPHTGQDDHADTAKSEDAAAAEVEHLEHVSVMDGEQDTETQIPINGLGHQDNHKVPISAGDAHDLADGGGDTPTISTPILTITPVTPSGEESKRLGYETTTTIEHTHTTQG
jgi:hypothetical protein